MSNKVPCRPEKESIAFVSIDNGNKVQISLVKQMLSKRGMQRSSFYNKLCCYYCLFLFH